MDEDGYPLREEATEPSPPPPPPIVERHEPAEEIYAAPVEPAGAEPGGPGGRRRFPGASPWPVLLAVVLLLAGLGAAYGLTRPGGSTHSPQAPVPPAAAAPAPPAPTPPPAASPPTTTPVENPPPAAPTPPTKVGVPSVVGTSLPRAVTALKQSKLVAAVTHVSSSAPEGRVLAQRPAAGATIPPGGRVQLSVAIQQFASVPNVTGLQGLVAVHTLQGDHLVASIRYVPSTQPARRVVSQWPPAGRSIRRGSSVRLNLSQGQRPEVNVPDVVGEDESTARSDLAGAGFTVRSVDTPTTDSSQDGVVVDESPSGGTSARRGSTVTISIGRYSGA